MYKVLKRTCWAIVLPTRSFVFPCPRCRRRRRGLPKVPIGLFGGPSLYSLFVFVNQHRLFMEQDVPIFGLPALRTRHRWSSQYAGRVSHMNLEMAYSSMVSLLLCGRASKRRIRRAEVQLLVGTQISFCLKLVTRRKNNSFRFIPDSKFIICLILFHCIPFSYLSISISSVNLSFFFFFIEIAKRLRDFPAQYMKDFQF